MPTSAELVIERYDPESVPGLRDEVLAVYAASHADQMRDPWFRPEPFWERLIGLYLPGRDFEIVLGRIAGQAVGYTFGGPRDQHAPVWDDLLTTSTYASANSPPRAHPQWSLPADPVPMYMFREFAVRPDHQRRGIGGRLHDALLQPRSEPVAELLVRKDNGPAQAAYRSWGWVQLGDKQPFPDSPIFDRLVLRLPAVSNTRGHFTHQLEG